MLCGLGGIFVEVLKDVSSGLAPLSYDCLLYTSLVAVYGNFVNRALQLTKKYFDGVVPAAGELNDYDRETLKEFADVKEDVEKLLDVFKFRDAQKEAMNLARIGNKYLYSIFEEFRTCSYPVACRVEQLRPGSRCI